MVLVTRDRDFGNPLLPTKVKEGIIILKLHNYTPSKLKGKDSENFLQNIEEKKIKKSLIIVEKARYRIREY